MAAVETGALEASRRPLSGASGPPSGRCRSMIRPGERRGYPRGARRVPSRLGNRTCEQHIEAPTLDRPGPAQSPPFGVGERLLGALVAAALRLLGATWRVHVEGPDPFAAGAVPVLGALLHRDFLVAAWHFRDRGIHVGVSRSRDGARIDAVLARLGYGASARGSSSSGGAAAQRTLLGRLQAGRSVAVVVDGPRGPAGEPKPGIVHLGRRSKVAIQPVTFEARPAWRFGSWDRAALPLPFARIECRYAEPLCVEDETATETATRELARRLG